MSNSGSEDEENESCPICVELFDGDDRLFQACDCQFRVCIFCVRKLMTEFDGRCPGCRKPYDESNFTMRQLTSEEIERRRLKAEKLKLQERSERMRSQKQQQVLNSNSASSSQRSNPSTMNSSNSGNNRSNNMTSNSKKNNNSNDDGTENALAQQRKSLANVKVLQPNAVFVVGLVQSIAKDEILRRPEYFGRFGPIIKIVIGHPAPVPGRAVTLSAHITFVKVEDALMAIQTLNGTQLENHPVRLSSGTTRYCHSFLRGQVCNTADCTYLHREVDPNASANNKANAQPPPPSLTPPPMVATPPPFQQQQLPPPSASSSSMVAPPEVPFDLSSNEPLVGGVEVSLLSKQRGNRAPQLTLNRAVGDGVNRVSSSSLPAAPPAHVAFDAQLGTLAQFILSRSTIPEESRMRINHMYKQHRQHRTSNLPAANNANATTSNNNTTRFNGLHTVFPSVPKGTASPPPLFVAPLLARGDKS